jgi:hypothetical protein
MSDFKEIGFARALARELYVHNYKEYGSPIEAAQDALAFINAFSIIFPDTHMHAGVLDDNRKPS